MLQNMKRGPQLSYQERQRIYTGLCEQRSKEEIAVMIGRDESTIGREIRRNSDASGLYLYPAEAHQAALDRKNRNKPKIDKRPNLQAFIEEKLQLRWSPDTIAGRWSLDNPEQTICRETIYTWLYSSNDQKKIELRKLLVRSHKKRGFRSKPTKTTIKNRVPIADRPAEINERQDIGHYEGDLMFNKGNRSKNVCTLIERVTRKSIIIHNDDKTTKTVIGGIIEYITKNKLIVKSITFDNGTEFADHTRLNQLGINTYFCEPGKPYQKGGIENFNGSSRRHLPFDLSADSITKGYVEHVTNMMNNMPRKIFGYKTPNEVYESMRKQLNQNKGGRVKLAKPATEAILFNESI